MSVASGTARRLGQIRDDLATGAARTDLESCRRYAETALDAALRLMSDEASTEDQRIAAFDYVRQAHTLRAKSATLPPGAAGTHEPGRR